MAAGPAHRGDEVGEKERGRGCQAGPGVRREGARRQPRFKFLL